VERTLVIAKPDAVRRGLVGEIVSRLERRGLRLVEMRMTRMDAARARAFYEQWADRTFFDDLVAFNSSGPVVAMVAEGEEAVRVVRKLIGATAPARAAPGTIRGDLALVFPENLVHGTHSPDRAEAEIGLFFP
jgi:nucleoside-diphosphate kinase